MKKPPSPEVLRYLKESLLGCSFFFFHCCQLRLIDRFFKLTQVSFHFANIQFQHIEGNFNSFFFKSAQNIEIDDCFNAGCPILRVFHPEGKLQIDAGVTLRINA